MTEKFSVRTNSKFKCHYVTNKRIESKAVSVQLLNTGGLHKSLEIVLKVNSVFKLLSDLV